MAASIQLKFREDDVCGTKICPFCLKNASKYICPKCNTQYCSLDCYKSEKHRECSETFYKDCVMENLKDYKASKSDREKVMEMLDRLERENGDIDSDDDVLDLEERIFGLDLDKDVERVWDQLTEKEKQEFYSMVKDGRLDNLIEVWTPWWKYKDDLVKEVTAKRRNIRPSILSNITNISSLLKNSKPSSDIKFNMVNVLYSYAFICRLHNGCHKDDPVNHVQEVLMLSDVLNRNANCISLQEAVSLCFESCNKNIRILEVDLKFSVSVLKDVEDIITGGSADKSLDFVLCALSDLHRLMHNAVKELSKEMKQSSDDKLVTDLSAQRKKLFANQKKLEFYMSWTQKYGMVLHMLIPEIQLERAARHNEEEHVAIEKSIFTEDLRKKLVEPAHQKKSLIEEIDT